MNSLLEDVLYKLELAQDNEEIKFYWDKAFSSLEKYMDSKYDETSVSNHFYDILAGLSIAEKKAGFKQGISFGIKFMMESLSPPHESRQEAEAFYKKWERPVEEVPS